MKTLRMIACINVLWAFAVTLILAPASIAYGDYFVDSGQTLSGSYSHDVVLGDVNNDGNLDAFVVNCDGEADTVWNNNGTGTFVDSGQRLGAIWSGEYYTSGQGVALGDLNGDEWPDAFVVNCSGEPNTVWYNNGGTFSDSGQRLGEIPGYSGTYSYSQGVALGDLDGDGDLDAFVAEADSMPNTVWFNHLGVFADSGQRLGAAVCHKAVALGDLDGDGDLDAFVAAGADGVNEVFLNDGYGNFSQITQPAFVGHDYTCQDVALGDVDGDGDLDAFVVNGWEAPDKVWLNNGNGVFSDSGQNLGGFECSQGVALGDINRDGHLDAFVVRAGGLPNFLYLNDGSGKFFLAQSMGSSYSHGVALGDLDGDGDLDAFVVNASSMPNEVWLNTATARISGTVYKSDGTTPVTGVQVRVNAFTGDPCALHEKLGSVLTDPSTGAYQFGYLPAGTYYLQTDGRPSGYENEWWADPVSVMECIGAQAITLGEEDVTGKNFQLEPSKVAIIYGPDAISTGYEDETPVIALDAAGNAHIVWTDGYNLFYKMVDRTGNVLIDQTNLNPCTMGGCTDWNHVRRPSVALDASGGLHIVFHGFSIRTDFGPEGYGGETPLSYSEVIYVKVNPYMDDRNGSPADPYVITQIPERIISTQDSSKSRAANISCDKQNNRFFVAWFDGPSEVLGPDAGANVVDIHCRVFGISSGDPVTSEAAVTEAVTVDTDWGEPEIRVDGNGNGHIVYCTKSGVTAAREVFYTMVGVSEDTVVTLIDDTMITADDGHYSVRPQLAVDSQNMVYVIWHDSRFYDEEIGEHELFLSKLAPYETALDGTAIDGNGLCVICEKEITANDGYRSYLKGIAVDEHDGVHLAWADQRDQGEEYEKNEIYYKMLDPSAQTLIDDTRITFSGPSEFPAEWWESSGRNPVIAAFAGRAYITFNVETDSYYYDYKAPDAVYDYYSQIHLAILAYTLGAPKTFYVDIVNGNDANDGSALAPWRTLHHAISQINGGDRGEGQVAAAVTLHVAPGTYSVANGEGDAPMVISQNNVTVIGQGGSGPVLNGTGLPNWTTGIEITVSNVTLQNLYVTGFSDESETGIMISSGTGNRVEDCKVYGNYDAISIYQSGNCTIQGCEIYSNANDGISITDSTGGTISENTIHDNVGTNSNGVIIKGCSPEVSRNKLYDNRFNISVEGSNSEIASPTIKNNLIYELISGSVSFGITIGGNGTSTVNPKIYHNTIDGGTYEGVIVEKYESSSINPEIKYNIITNFRQYGIQNAGGSPIIDYNDVWNNEGGNYSGCSAGLNDISQDPLYGSYALQSTSPCIDKIPSADDPVAVDYPGYSRPKGPAKDMGAYEYVGAVAYPYTLPGGAGLVTDYRIFTVPLNMGTGADLLSAMEETLGTYDPATWRGFAYYGGQYLEFNSPAFTFLKVVPGMAFWIITLYSNPIQFEAGICPDGVPYVLDLPPDWSLIALPWINTPIDLGNIFVSDGTNTYSITSLANPLTQQCVWDYTGSGPYSGYEKRNVSSYSLQCGTGYFIKVLAGSPVKLIIPPNNAVGASLFPGDAGGAVSSGGNEEEPPSPPGGSSEPIPDIKANGQDGPVAVSSGTAVSITIGLHPGDQAGQWADWWLAAATPFGWYSYVYPTGWQAGIHRAALTPLFELTPQLEVLKVPLAAGNYTFYFAVDDNADGDVNATWLDSLEVRVE